MKAFRTSWFVWLMPVLCSIANGQGDAPVVNKPPSTDYCQWLEHEVQGRKHGFLAGNVTYYVGGYHASWNLVEDETLGLTRSITICAVAELVCWTVKLTAKKTRAQGMTTKDGSFTKTRVFSTAASSSTAKRTGIQNRKACAGVRTE